MNPLHAQMPSWMTRLVNRRHGAAPSTLMHPRVEVCPPELWPSSLSWQGRWSRLKTSLLGRLSPWLPEPARPVNRLAIVKAEFMDTLSDLPGELPEQLLGRIDSARSLRELWHLRSPVFGMVATATNQAEATRRLALLNRHFPVRAPRTGLQAMEP